MRTPKNNIPVDLIRDRLEYNAETGIFTWKKSIRAGHAGKVAGYKRRDGYIIINFDKEICLAHRLAWVCAYGRYPSTGIDHINGNPGDNRLCNLREAKPNENHWNMKLFINNTSGYRGVTRHKKTGKWCAEIWYKRKKYYLGLFKTKELASQAVEAARARMFGKFNRLLPEQTANNR